ncbi:hypothetical protein GWN90_11425 [candidate division KSB1 bacterium]|nr:hypothetical protein [candidate division KSB1 bacterium]
MFIGVTKSGHIIGCNVLCYSFSEIKNVFPWYLPVPAKLKQSLVTTANGFAKWLVMRKEKFVTSCGGSIAIPCFTPDGSGEIIHAKIDQKLKLRKRAITAMDKLIKKRNFAL